MRCSSLAGHDKSAGDEAFVESLLLIERAATDERNFVKKGVIWALRRIGRRNAAAVMVARRLADPSAEKRPFLVAVTIGRLLRFGILSVLTLIFGQQIVSGTSDLVRHHPWIAVLVGIVVIAVLYFIYRMLREPAVEVAKEIEKHERPESRKDL